MSSDPRYDCLEMPLVVGRVATLPVQRATELLAAPDPLEATRAFYERNALARTAVAIASPSLAAALEDWIAGRPLRNPKTPLRALCYALRMAARATPFGLFAGVGEVETGDEQTLEIDEASPRYRSHTRPDMEILSRVAAEVEAGALRGRVGYVTNDCAFVNGGRLHVTNLALTNVVAMGAMGVREQREVSLRHTKAVAFVRTLCSEVRSYDEIVAALCAEFGAPANESERLLDRLIEAGVLVSELRPSPAGDPIAYAVARLGEIGALPPALGEAIEASRRLDATPLAAQTAQDYARVSAAFSQTVASPPENAIQVDLQAAFRGTLGKAVLRDAAELVGLALRRGQVARMGKFRDRFMDRYEGVNRLVPLLELVDNNLGLGFPDESSYEDDEEAAAARKRALAYAFAEAARTNAEELELDGELFDAAFPAREGGILPSSVECGFELAAGSEEALSRGDYRMVATMFSEHAGRFVGRFAGMLGERAVERVRQIASRTSRDGELVAEFAYVPPDARAYNVAIRPRMYDCEVRAGIGEPAGGSISPSDLWVGIDGGRFYLWSESRGSRVSLRETHAFVTTMNAPNLCRLLAMIRNDGVRLPSLELGEAASNAVYLPRLRRGRLVLQVRRWRFPRTAFGGAAGAGRALESLRERWGLPRYVQLCDGDNRLLLDLDSSIAPALLEDQARGRSVQLEEALPSPAQTWLRGSGGTHAAEFVAQAVATDAAPAAPRGRPEIVRERERHGPGSQWTYLKLYLGAQAADDFLLSAVVPLVRELQQSQVLDRWFFLRYRDTAYHVRLRLHAADAAAAAMVRERALAAAESWLAARTVTRYALDTYDPEYERYGGPDLMARVEAFFTFDSELCAAVLAERPEGTDARIEVAAATFDALVRSSGAATKMLLDGYAEVGKQKLGSTDREALRRLAAAPAAAEPGALDGLLDGPGAQERLGSLVHMHCNRLGLDPDAERRAVCLLRALALGRSARAGRQSDQVAPERVEVTA